jgi:sulfoxide reductase heme-binding subunit YedZ
LRSRLLHAGVVLAGLLPLLALGFDALTSGLGADPIERVTHVTGEWGLRLLLASLAVTPLRRLGGFAGLAPFRRTLGLLAFSYATLHMLTYVALDQSFDLPLLLEDVLERRYVTAGFAAWLCLLPLALTSTRASIKRLGRRWVTLHRLAYVAGVLAVVHFLWLVKADLLAPILHAAVLALLLAARFWKPRRG